MTDNQKKNFVAKYLKMDSMNGGELEIISDPSSPHFGMILDSKYGDIIDFSESPKEGYEEISLWSGFKNPQKIYGYCNIIN